MKPLVSNIPQEFRDRPQWVFWKRVERDGKATKPPYNPRTGGLAESTDPSTWGTIQEALIACETYGGAGIGFVFSENDPFTGIDLDKCVNPETGELEAWARRWVDLFKSYTEFSPSGRGVHIIITGKLPDRGRKKGNFEIYDKGRFFTFTGCVFDGRNSI